MVPIPTQRAAGQTRPPHAPLTPFRRRTLRRLGRQSNPDGPSSAAPGLHVRALRAQVRIGSRHRHKQPDHEQRLPHPPASKVPDPVVQRSTGGPAAISTATNFDGIGSGNYSVTGVPPDPNAAVGSSQIVGRQPGREGAAARD